MRSKRVLRYYCDHCKKSGCSKGHMARHETHCTNNPQRCCRFCDLEKPPTAELIAVFTEECEGGDGALKRLREIADDCPACILAGIRQGRGKRNRITHDEHGAPSDEDNHIDFDFKKEAEIYLAQKRESEADNESWKPGFYPI